MSERDKGLEMAVHRYEAIAAYVAEDPPRGRRRSMLERLAEKAWTRPDGKTATYSVETLRRWIHLYRRGGLDGLRDKGRPGRRSQVLAPHVVEEACRLKKEVPERSVRRIIRILEEFGTVEAGVGSHALSARNSRALSAVRRRCGP